MRDDRTGNACCCTKFDPATAVTDTTKRFGLAGGLGCAKGVTELSVLSPLSAVSLGVGGLAKGKGDGALAMTGSGNSILPSDLGGPSAPEGGGGASVLTW